MLFLRIIIILALICCGAAQAAATQSVEAKLKEAAAAIQRGDLVSAERLLRAALKSDSEAVAAYNLLGFVLLNTGRAADAEAALKQALKLDPVLSRGANEPGQSLLRDWARSRFRSRVRTGDRRRP